MFDFCVMNLSDLIWWRSPWSLPVSAALLVVGLCDWVAYMPSIGMLVFVVVLLFRGPSTASHVEAVQRGGGLQSLFTLPSSNTTKVSLGTSVEDIRLSNPSAGAVDQATPSPMASLAAGPGLQGETSSVQGSGSSIEVGNTDEDGVGILEKVRTLRLKLGRTQHKLHRVNVVVQKLRALYMWVDPARTRGFVALLCFFTLFLFLLPSWLLFSAVSLYQSDT